MFNAMGTSSKRRLALVAIPAKGPAFGEIDEFTIEFDRYAPAKRRVRRRPPEIWLNRLGKVAHRLSGPKMMWTD